MVSVLKNQWSLLRLAAGLSRPATPRGWVLNALRAVNFVVLIAFLAWPIFCFLFWWVALLLLASSVNNFAGWSPVYLYVSVIISGVTSFLLLPKLIILHVNTTDNLILVTSVKGFALTAAVTFSLVTLLFLSVIPVTINDFQWLPALAVTALLAGFLSVGFTFWLLTPSKHKISAWLLNMFAVILLAPIPIVILFFFFFILALNMLE